MEIDEILIIITRRKYNRGSEVSQQWFFGGIQTNAQSFYYFIELVEDRTKKL